MIPSVTTTRDLIRIVADRWGRQYSQPRTLTDQSNTAEKHAKLLALNGETATEGDVEAIIGNGGWTKQTCSQCKLESDWLCCVGEPPDYESQTAMLCQSCLRAAAKLLPTEPNTSHV